MKYLFTCMLILSAGELFSQVTPSRPIEQWQKDRKVALWVDSLIAAKHPKAVFVDGKKVEIIGNPGIQQRMPTKLMENEGVYQYNNGKGFDVYSMKTDNMPCLVPDSTFQTRFPGADASKRGNLKKRP